MSGLVCGFVARRGLVLAGVAGISLVVREGVVSLGLDHVLAAVLGVCGLDGFIAGFLGKCVGFVAGLHLIHLVAGIVLTPGRRSRHGVEVQEAEWKSAEVEALYRLADAGVRVPAPIGVHDGVLLMELVRDEDGHPAPRLNEVEMTASQAREWHAFMIEQIVRMLCAGLIHGDLSEFNVLLGTLGPVVIDLPQAVDAASNNNAFRMLARELGRRLRQNSDHMLQQADELRTHFRDIDY